MENTNLTVAENKNTLPTTDLAGMDLLDQLKNPESGFYCSITNDGTRKTQIAIYNAIQGDDDLANHIGETLEIVNVVAHPAQAVDEETGEITNYLRTVLIDKNGKGYTAGSMGVTSALSRIFSIIGRPDNGAWEKEPVKMKIKQIKTKNGQNKVNTIELV